MDFGLFEDTTFQPSSSLLHLKKEDTILWLRPEEFCPGEPTLFQQDPQPEDVLEGSIGNCYLIAAMSVIAENPQWIKRLFEQQQVNPSGMYRISLFHQGEWLTITIDDRIPCRESTNAPLYAKSRNPCELWVCLLEKAYAKLYGGYNRIDGGHVSEALLDLTGEAVLDFNLMDKNVREVGAFFNLMIEILSQEISSGIMWKRMLDSRNKGYALATAKIVSKKEFERASSKSEIASQNNILLNHAYGITDMQVIPSFSTARQSAMRRERKAGAKAENDRNSLHLLRIRNPWGHFEWEGDFGANSSLWTSDLRSRLNFNPDSHHDRGSFWMCFSDFLRHFTRVYICATDSSSTALSLHHPHKHIYTIPLEWCGKTAGGCTLFPTWRHNPKIRLDVEQNCRIAVTITQPDQRMKRTHYSEDFEKMDYPQIGCTLVVPSTGVSLDPAAFVRPRYVELIKTSFWNKRDVSFELELSVEQSPYILVPSTYFPHQDTLFQLIIRTHTSSLTGVPLVRANLIDWNDSFPFSHLIKGEWVGKSAGGRPKFASFRRNHQYVMRITQRTRFYFFLSQSVSIVDEDKGQVSKSVGIGVYILKNSESFNQQSLSQSLCVGQVSFTNTPEVVRYEYLDPVDSPFLIIPCTYEPRKELSFALEIMADCEFTVHCANLESKNSEPKESSPSNECVDALCTMLNSQKLHESSRSLNLRSGKHVQPKANKSSNIALIGANVIKDSSRSSSVAQSAKNIPKSITPVQSESKFRISTLKTTAKSKGKKNNRQTKTGKHVKMDQNAMEKAEMTVSGLAGVYSMLG